MLHKKRKQRYNSHYIMTQEVTNNENYFVKPNAKHSCNQYYNYLGPH